MLYLIDEIAELDDGFPERAKPLLSEERCAKVFARRLLLDRKLSTAVYLLLRLALMQEHGIDEAVIFAYGENGKPTLRDHPHIHFNLSHCSTAAACVISNLEAGVDVQKIAPVSDALAKRVLSPKEYEAFQASQHPDKLFCRFWTMKESWLKQTGRGLVKDLAALSTEQMTNTVLLKGQSYYCCVSGNFDSIRYVKARDFAALQSDT